MVDLTVSSCHVIYAFQSESTLHNCLNAIELLAQSWSQILRLVDWSWTETEKNLVPNQTLNHSAKLA